MLRALNAPQTLIQLQRLAPNRPGTLVIPDPGMNLSETFKRRRSLKDVPKGAKQLERPLI